MNDYYLKNKEKLNEYSKNWYKQNRNKQLEYAKRYSERNNIQILINSAKTRAIKNNWDFNISIDDLVIPEFCPYLGIKLTNEKGKGRMPSSYSLDRIDSTFGYIFGNVQIISELANRMKQNATEEQLITFAKGVLKLHA